MIPAKLRVRRPSSFSRFDKLTGRRRHLSPKGDEIVVTLDPAVAGQVVEHLVSKMALQLVGANYERGFAIFRLPLQEDREAVVVGLQRVTGVWNAITAMFENGEAVYILPDEVTVQFKEGVDKESALTVLGSLGSSIVVEQRLAGFYTVAVPKESDVFTTIDRLCLEKQVLFAEVSEVGLGDLAATQNEEYFRELWGLDNQGQKVNGCKGKKGADIKILGAWKTGVKGIATVIIVVVDTGVDLLHSDLSSVILPRNGEDWDFSSDSSVVPEDLNGHGTHVAGIACAAENRTGVVGVAPGCMMIPLKVGLICGMCQDRADAIGYVAGLAAGDSSRRFIMNISWGRYTYNDNIKNAIALAIAANVVVVAGAGNDSRDICSFPFYPAVFPGVVAVAATDQRDVKADCSNYGKRIDVAAPGVNIYSTYLGGSFAFACGTSCAAPYVSGLAGLIWSKNLGLTSSEVVDRIRRGADSVDGVNSNFVGGLGTGRINALKSLNIKQ